VHVRDAANPIFGNLPPYLRQKDVLSYRVLVHIRSVADFDPVDPSPSLSPPTSDDGDCGHDGNPDRHHFSRGRGPRIQGYRCHRGTVDGEQPAVNNGGSTSYGRTVIIADIAEEEAAPDGQPDNDAQQVHVEVVTATHAPGTLQQHKPKLDDACQLEIARCTAEPTNTGDQLASDPMLLEAELLSRPVRELICEGTHHSTMPELVASPALINAQTTEQATGLCNPITVTADVRIPCDAHGLGSQGSGPSADDAPDEQTAVHRNTAASTAPVEEHGACGHLATPPTENIDADDHAGQGNTDVLQPTPSVAAVTLAGFSPSTSPPPPPAGATADSTPSPSEAARRLAKFTGEVLRKRATPLIASPPKQKAPARKPVIPLRSRRIASQQLGHIPVSKRGEVLAMKKLGFTHPNAQPTSADRRSYDSFFRRTLTDGEVAAMDELLPATKPRAGRAARRPIVAAA
jgi:hypothetical protein